MPIRSGPCKGMRWSLPTRTRFIRGVYEPKLASFLAASLKSDDVFWDIGAHYGYYTLLAARMLQRGACFAFEPNAQNRWYLEHHVRWNRLANVTVLPWAIAETDGTRIFGGGGAGSGRLGRGKKMIPMRSIDSLVESHKCHRPSVIKIDAEGGELRALNGRTLKNGVDLVCIATHSLASHATCRLRLIAWGYDIRNFRDNWLIIATSGQRVLSGRARELMHTIGRMSR